MPVWAWRIGRAVALMAACGLGVLGGAVLVALHLLGVMNMGWAIVITLIVIGLIVTASLQLADMAARQREAQQRAAIAASVTRAPGPPIRFAGSSGATYSKSPQAHDRARVA